MTIDRNTLASLGLTLLLITSVIPAGIVGLSGTASANHGGAWYTLSQPGTDVCYEVQAFTYDHEKMVPEVEKRGSNEYGDVTGPYRDSDWNGFESIESMMDYRYRYVPEGSDGAVGQTSYYAPYLNDQYRLEGWEHGTYGLYNWSENGDSHLWFYQNANGEVSLVIRHDRLYENVGTSSHGPYNGISGPYPGFFEPSPGDGQATFEFDDLPSGEWAYIDDMYPNAGLDDYYTDGNVRYGHREANYQSQPLREFTGGRFRVEWVWNAWSTNDSTKHGTDGGAYRGFQNLAEGESVTITNSFSGDISEWEVRHNNGSTNGVQQDLVMGEPLVVTRGRACLDDGGSLTASPNPVEGNRSVTFTAPDGASEYRWDFDGDGTIDANTSDPTRTHTYNESGEMQASVTMVDGGQTVEKTTTVTVRPSQSPTADFGVEDGAGDPEHVVVGESIAFNGSASTDNVGVTSYEWNFNGTAKSGTAVNHTFDSAGTHEVTLDVTDSAGNADDVTKTITVVAQDDPTAEASVSPTEVEAGANVTFDGSASSDDHGAVASYEWDVTGEGGPDETGVRANWTFDSPGAKSVTLTVEDNNGNTDTTNLTVSVTNATEPTIDSVDVPESVSSSGTLDVSADANDESPPLTYTWRVVRDDEVTAEKTGRSPSATFTDFGGEGNATVELVVADAAGHTSSIARTVEVTGRPSAALSADPEKTKVGETVTLDASNSSDTGGIAEFRWDFDGDGTYDANTTANSTIETTYDGAGTYDATVQVVDDDGGTDTATVQVEIEQDEQAYSGGGGGGSTSLGPPPVMTNTERVGPNEAAIDVRNGRGDQTIRASLPTSEVANRTGVRFERVAVDLANDDTHVVFRTAASADAPEGTPALTANGETLAYLDVGANYRDAPVENATVTVTVRKAALGKFAAAGDVAVYRYDGTWTRANATVVENTADAVRLKVTTRGLGTLAVGASEGLAVTDARLASGTVTTGETVEATATVENRGESPRTVTLNLTLSGNVVTSRTVKVPAAGTRDVTLSGTAPTPGTYDVTVGGASAGTLSVQEAGPADLSVANVSLGSSTIRAGEEVQVVATVENAGGKPGERTVTLTMFGEELASKTVRVPAGQTRRVTFEQRVDAAGTYSVKVDGETATLKVTNDGSKKGIAERAPNVPGFGVGATLVALAAAALLARTRR